MSLNDNTLNYTGNHISFRDLFARFDEDLSPNFSNPYHILDQILNVIIHSSNQSILHQCLECSSWVCLLEGGFYWRGMLIRIGVLTCIKKTVLNGENLLERGVLI